MAEAKSKKRKYLFVLLVLILPLSLLGTEISPILTSSSSWKPGKKLVATYYFYWYDSYTGWHFVNPDGSDALTDHPPKKYLKDYSYTEVSWHRRELLDMIDARIDIVLPVYWGNDWNFFWSKPGLLKLVEAVDELITDGHTPPKIGMFYDTTALQDQNNGIPPYLTTKKGKALFYSMIADFFNLIPKRLWAKIDGRPIVFIWGSQFVSDYNQNTFKYVYKHFLDEFGAKPYIVREGSWQEVKTEGKYYWGAAVYGPLFAKPIGSVGPGYDETATQRPKPNIRDRECGNFYNDSWDEMINAGVSLISVETWNEFHEGSDIAASQEYRRTYIELTAQNIFRWKTTKFNKAFMAWLDLGRHSFLKGLRPAFNSADGAWRVKKKAKREAAHPNHKTTPPSYYIYLDVNNDFINATPTEVWVTVEYYDRGTDQWWLDYDSTSEPYSSTPPVMLQNTRQWRRHTFHLQDAFFGGRQHNGADLRLSDDFWEDGKTNYFGRIWISKLAPNNQAPDIVGLKDITLEPGEKVKIPISSSDPDGDSIVLALGRDVRFATVRDKGNGKGTLRLAPKDKDIQPCPYRVTITATDVGNPALTDAVTFRVSIKEKKKKE
jgi:hypothetical protein